MIYKYHGVASHLLKSILSSAGPVVFFTVHEVKIYKYPEKHRASRVDF